MEATDILHRILEYKKTYRINKGKWPKIIVISMDTYKILSDSGLVSNHYYLELKPDIIYLKATVCGMSICITEGGA